MHKVTIDNKKVSIGRFPAREGWSLLRKLTSIVGPSLAEIADDKYGNALNMLFEKLPEDDFLDMLDQLTGICLVDDAKYSEKHLGNYMFTVKVCKAVLEHNFDDFFSPIVEAMKGLLGKVDAKTS